MALLGASAAAAFVTAPAQGAETFKLDLSSPANAETDPGLAPARSSLLTAGQKYVVIVSGTGSIWGPGTFSKKGTCGIAEAAPMEPTPGRQNALAAWDAATMFAAPIGVDVAPLGQVCANSALPRSSANFGGAAPYAGFEFATAKNYSRPAPVGGYRTVPRADHTYAWEITGTGQALRVRFADRPSDDNSGVLTLTVLTAEECAASSCLGKQAPEQDAVAPLIPVPAAAPLSVPTEGVRTCGRNQSLTVRLVEPKGVDYSKVTFFFNGKKTRVLYRQTKRADRRLIYTSGKKKGQIRPQSFLGLPRNELKLRLQLTTTRNQTSTVKRTIPACGKAVSTKRVKFS